MNYSDVKKAYKGFQLPKAEIEVEGKSFGDNKAGFIIQELHVELSCGYEASEAVFCISGCVDIKTGEYMTKELRPYILLGSYVLVKLGYNSQVKEVFRGFISCTEFMNEEGTPCVRVTAMDIKGIMMANSYAKQLKSRYISDAVKELLEKPVYQELTSKEVIKRLDIRSTPDKMRGNADKNRVSMEMISMSDYEFIVRGASKSGFEFFTDLGVVYFRKARADENVYLTFGPGDGITSYRISYSLSGLTGAVEVRSMEDGKGKLVSAKKKLNNKISMGNYGKKLIGQSECIQIDSTVRTKEEAEDRLEFFEAQTAYRFGLMECECVGIPELLPGRFMKIEGLGSPADNRFYVEQVRHEMDHEYGYRCRLTGRTDRLT